MAPRSTDELSARAASWSRALTERLGRRVDVAWSRSRKTPLSMEVQRGQAGRVELRLHSMFAAGDDALREAVARWVSAGRRASRACQLIDEFVEAELAATRPAPPRMVAQGRVHDLDAIADEVVHEHFADDWRAAARPQVGWGRSASKARRGLRLGSYDPDSRSVRIHPVLDQEAVPRWAVAFVVFHELLHHRHPPRRDAQGRMVHHGAEFRARETAHAQHAAMRAWERRNIAALVASASSGRPLPVPPGGPDAQAQHAKRAVQAALVKDT